MDKILIAVDGSEASACALRRGLERAEGEGAAVTIAYVAPATDVDPGSLFGATAIPRTEIVAYADSLGVDLIVVGSRGLGRIGRMILGSVSRGVLRESRRPVLVVREVEAPVAACS